MKKLFISYGYIEKGFGQILENDIIEYEEIKTKEDIKSLEARLTEKKSTDDHTHAQNLTLLAFREM